MKFEELASIDVSGKIERKNGLAYLSWAWAVDQLLRRDPAATWVYGEPARWGETWLVYCSVTAFGVTRTAQLPVMDHRNKAITNPDSFAVNTAMQRCLAKAIALHGIGLYIYAGEDMPTTVEGDTVSEALLKKAEDSAKKGLKAYERFWKALAPSERKELLPEHERMKKLAADAMAAMTEKA